MQTSQYVLKLIGILLPIGILAFYLYLVAGYARYFDFELNYIPQAVKGAPEDILGFGFWIPWSLILCLLGISCVATYLFSFRYWFYFVAITIAFILISGADFYLHEMLSQKVLLF